MNKKLIISLIMIGVMAFGAGLGTFAWFTSISESTSTFETGTLNLNVDGTVNDTFTMDLGTITGLQPGDPATSIDEIVMENTGNLNLGMFRKFDITAVDGDVAGAEALAKQLEVVNYTVEDWSTGGGAFDFVNLWETNASKLNEWDVDDNGFVSLYDLTHINLDDSGKWALLGLKPGYDQTITIAFKLNNLATREVAGKSVNLEMKVIATQINADAIQYSMDNDGLTGFGPRFSSATELANRFAGHMNDARQPDLLD